jgi:hypothetical protein
VPDEFAEVPAAGQALEHGASANVVRATG